MKPNNLTKLAAGLGAAFTLAGNAGEADASGNGYKFDEFTVTDVQNAPPGFPLAAGSPVTLEFGHAKTFDEDPAVDRGVFQTFYLNATIDINGSSVTIRPEWFIGAEPGSPSGFEFGKIIVETGVDSWANPGTTVDRLVFLDLTGGETKDPSSGVVYTIEGEIWAEITAGNSPFLDGATVLNPGVIPDPELLDLSRFDQTGGAVIGSLRAVPNNGGPTIDVGLSTIVVPEPGLAVGLGIGAGVLAAAARRRKNNGPSNS